MIASTVAVLLLWPTPADAQRQTAEDLSRRGWAAIRSGKHLEAYDIFRDAIQLDPRDLRVLLGAGLSAHLLGRADEARQHLTAALQIDPTLTEASLLLGQILHRDGDTARRPISFAEHRVTCPDPTRFRSRGSRKPSRD